MLAYDIRVQVNCLFDYCKVFSMSNDDLREYTRLIWYGYDEVGPAVYRKNPETGMVVRIDFLKESV